MARDVYTTNYVDSRHNILLGKIDVLVVVRAFSSIVCSIIILIIKVVKQDFMSKKHFQVDYRLSK